MVWCLYSKPFYLDSNVKRVKMKKKENIIVFIYLIKYLIFGSLLPIVLRLNRVKGKNSNWVLFNILFLEFLLALFGDSTGLRRRNLHTHFCHVEEPDPVLRRGGVTPPLLPFPWQPQTITKGGEVKEVRVSSTRVWRTLSLEIYSSLGPLDLSPTDRVEHRGDSSGTQRF